jgi:hypothetical protein
MMTVMDHARPWLTPSSTLAATIHPQEEGIIPAEKYYTEVSRSIAWRPYGMGACESGILEARPFGFSLT